PWYIAVNHSPPENVYFIDINELFHKSRTSLYMSVQAHTLDGVSRGVSRGKYELSFWAVKWLVAQTN
ncbi:hypothetical protein J1785_01100, partial [Rahnella sp. SL6]|uniref:hypothetical protein n=1 Tax=Rahnella perminowiae TaxID=2816244 RepID=UPI001C26F086